MAEVCNSRRVASSPDGATLFRENGWMIVRYARIAVYSVLAAAASYVATRLYVERGRAPEPVAVATTGSWYARARPHCNAVEVETFMRQDRPDLGTLDGVSYAAACYALAGKVDTAKVLILQLQPDDRYRAAGVVFDIGHPVADAGDDLSAAPIMELVLFFWPNHYMALYHAGASAYQLGHYARATQHLEAFRKAYTANDGWVGAADGMLRMMREHPQAKPQRVEDPHG
jgi:hypothetical protein